MHSLRFKGMLFITNVVKLIICIAPNAAVFYSIDVDHKHVFCLTQIKHVRQSKWTDDISTIKVVWWVNK